MSDTDVGCDKKCQTLFLICPRFHWCERKLQTSIKIFYLKKCNTAWVVVLEGLPNEEIVTLLKKVREFSGT